MNKLTGVHPKLISAVQRITYAFHELGAELMVTDGVRTEEQQAALYSKGRSTPGAIVTNADGVRKRSNHQTHADGLGHAVDLCFVVDGKPSWDTSLPWDLIGAMARQQCLTWGGDWKMRDQCHLELREESE